MITAEQLKSIVPLAKQSAVDTFLPHLNRLMPIYGIDTARKEAAFISQLAHESGSFRYVREIASGAAYEGKKNLGNINPGDGVRYKGRGLIQITGRNNYREVSKHIFGEGRILLSNPDLLATPKYAVQSACWFWQAKNLNAIAEQPDDKVYTIIRVGKPTLKLSPFKYITFRVNGGFNGYEDRLAFYERAKEVLNV